jgi:hypothetical protein
MVSAAVLLRIHVCWNVMLSSWVGVTRRFEGTTVLQNIGKHAATQHNIPQNLSPQDQKDYFMGQAVYFGYIGTWFQS